MTTKYETPNRSGLDVPPAIIVPLPAPDEGPPPDEVLKAENLKEVEEREATKEKRWRVALKLQEKYERRRQKKDAKIDRRRLERFRRNYDNAAHILIDIVTDTEDDEEKRQLWRVRLEQRMRVQRMPPVQPLPQRAVSTVKSQRPPLSR